MAEAGVGPGIVPETTAGCAVRDLTSCLRSLTDLPPSARQIVAHLRKGD